MERLGTQQHQTIQAHSVVLCVGPTGRPNVPKAIQESLPRTCWRHWNDDDDVIEGIIIDEGDVDELQVDGSSGMVDKSPCRLIVATLLLLSSSFIVAV